MTSTITENALKSVLDTAVQDIKTGSQTLGLASALAAAEMIGIAEQQGLNPTALEAARDQLRETFHILLRRDRDMVVGEAAVGKVELRARLEGDKAPAGTPGLPAFPEDPEKAKGIFLSTVGLTLLMAQQSGSDMLAMGVIEYIGAAKARGIPADALAQARGTAFNTVRHLVVQRALISAELAQITAEGDVEHLVNVPAPPKGEPS